MSALFLILIYAFLEGGVAFLAALLAAKIISVCRYVGDRRLLITAAAWLLISASAVASALMLASRYAALSSLGRVAPGDLEVLGRASMGILVFWSAIRAAGFALLVPPSLGFMALFPFIPDAVSTGILGFISARTKGAPRLIYAVLALGHAIRAIQLWNGHFPLLGEGIVAATLMAALLWGVRGSAP